jgi:hypothetical protein
MRLARVVDDMAARYDGGEIAATRRAFTGAGRRSGAMAFDWYHRLGVDPWQMKACDEHGAQLAELGFQRGLLPHYAAHLGTADGCALCSGSTSMEEVRACRCNVLGLPCPVHRPAPAGAPGEWTRVRCIKCGAELQLPSERIAFEHGDYGLVAVDITGWARRNGDGDELRCPFHGAAVYFLEHVDGPIGDVEDEDDRDEDQADGAEDLGDEDDGDNDDVDATGPTRPI